MSYELICFHTSIIKHLSRRYVMVGSLSFLSRSSYGIHLTLSAILVALIWTFSIACNCLLLIKPPHTAPLNSRCWRTNALYNGITISVVQQVELLLMMPSIVIHNYTRTAWKQFRIALSYTSTHIYDNPGNYIGPNMLKVPVTYMKQTYQTNNWVSVD